MGSCLLAGQLILCFSSSNKSTTKMPGHIKLVKGLADPDPTEFLLPSIEMKRADQAKVYDTKKSVWIPDPKTQGYREGLLESGDLEDPASKCLVVVGHEKFTHKAAEVGRVNPPKFEKCEDMVNLTFLNDASVFWNLKTRYQAKMIHTCSGLFVVVVNPYKRYPIYTHRVCKIYLGKRRNEVPPHLWAIAECAYRNMLQTKKVITYLAMVATGSGKKEVKKVSLEDQIVATNPILESYGNATTARNDNSSRFGKFIRIHFTQSGKLAGCDIVSYLLEKSRITEQQSVERSYHIFYQLLQPYGDGICDGGLRAKCFVSNDIYDYIYVSQGKTSVPTIDDNEELEYTEDAFTVLGIEEWEKFDCYVLTAGVMTCGGVQYIQEGRDEQAELSECGPDTFIGKLASAFGVDAAAMVKAFCKPRIKVGTEWVTKGQNIEQATGATGGIARAIFDRVFKWLIEKCNDTLIDPTLKKANFCAVLDIAGFEIFEYNGFEQISINFVNEKLQQFFNHHMFVVEQEEYVKEGIDWVMVDFGMDLAAAIIMFEKPMGIWAILEEESLFPKATDKSFEAKLKAQHLGKHNNFAKAQSKTDKDAHFAVVHYAGTVSYNVTGWLDKNRDPINDTVVDLLKKSKTCKLVNEIYADHPGQTKEEEDLPPPGHRRGKKRVVVKSKTAAKMANFKTVCSYFKDQLNNLINMLMTTEPSFIRCIVPNNHKKPGVVDPFLVMHQLTCNGVLEGIRICRKGFPNRVVYLDFRTRYAILAPKEAIKAMKMVKRPVTEEKKNIAATHAVMDKVALVGDKFQYGHSKIFFRAGILGLMEEIRDDRINDLVAMFQGAIRAFYARRIYKKLWDHKYGLLVVQRTVRNYMIGKKWLWWTMWLALKPNLKSGNFEMFKIELAEKIQFAQDHLDEVIKEREASA